MTSFDTVLFPDTDIFKEKLYPLFLLCHPVHYLRTVEPAPDRERTETDLFMESGLCQAYTPAPLGADRDRFQRLVNDIEHRKDDYAAQLTALTVAGLSASKRETGGEMRSEIISSLLKNHELQGDVVGYREMVLWQSRLVLAIAEILDREERVLLQELQYLDDKEITMFQELQGDSDEDGEQLFNELEQIRSKLQIPRPREIRTRFGAWLKLMDCKSFAEPDLWLATSPDAGDEIFTRYEKEGKKTAIPILKLTLPGKIEVGPVHLVNQVKQFHEAAVKVHDDIVSDFAEICQTSVTSPAPAASLLPGKGDYVEQWDRLVAEHFPASSHGTSSVTFYLLPECSIARLLALAADAESAVEKKHGLLAVLHG